MEIRRLQFSDLDRLLSLYEHLNPVDSPLPAREVVESLWADLTSGSHYRYYGGFLSEQLISSCTLSVIPNLTRGCKPYGLIENVVTHANHRNKGAGKAILAHTLADAWSAGCYKVLLLTGSQNPATLHFYNAAGFDPNEKRAFIARPAA